MHRVFIVHGLGEFPESGWFPWLKDELRKRKLEVYIPHMPDSDFPKIEKWISYLDKCVGKIDEETHFIGHGMGCQAIMRYLEKADGKCGGVLFVAGWIKLKELMGEDNAEVICTPWLQTPINYDKVRSKARKFVAIFSDDDPYADQSNADMFKSLLCAKVVIDRQRGHFTEADCVMSLHSALREIVEAIK